MDSPESHLLPKFLIVLQLTPSKTYMTSPSLHIMTSLMMNVVGPSSPKRALQNLDFDENQQEPSQRKRLKKLLEQSHKLN